MGGNGAHAPFTLHGLDQDRGCLWRDGPINGFMVGKANLIKALDFRAEAFEIFGLSAGCNGCQSPSVESAFKGDDAVAFGMAVGIVIFACHFDGAFKRLGTGIGEEHRVGKCMIDKPLCQPCAFGDLVEIGDVP